MNRSKALKVLVEVRERRGRRIETAVQEALRREGDADAGVNTARQALTGVLAAQSTERAKLHALTDPGQTFDIRTLMLREHVADTMKTKVSEQQREVERCSSVLVQCTQDVRSRRTELARNLQRIDTLQADIDSWRAAQQLAQDDEQDEEAEEAAIGRLVQAQRGAAASSAGAE